MSFITYHIVFNNELNEETLTKAITVYFSVVYRIADAAHSKSTQSKLISRLSVASTRGWLELT